MESWVPRNLEEKGNNAETSIRLASDSGPGLFQERHLPRLREAPCSHLIEVDARSLWSPGIVFAIPFDARGTACAEAVEKYAHSLWLSRRPAIQTVQRPRGIKARITLTSDFASMR